MNQPPTLTIEPAGREDKHLLRNLIELCQYDYSEFNGSDVDRHGLFGYPYLDHYWTEEGRYAFIFRAAGQVAGFALVRGLGEDGGSATYSLAEFCILRAYRRRGLGEAAATWLFERFPGVWRVGQEPGNLPAQRFWRATIGRYTGGDFVEVGAEDGPVQTYRSPAHGGEESE